MENKKPYRAYRRCRDSLANMKSRMGVKHDDNNNLEPIIFITYVKKCRTKMEAEH